MKQVLGSLLMFVFFLGLGLTTNSYAKGNHSKTFVPPNHQNGAYFPPNSWDHLATVLPECRDGICYGIAHSIAVTNSPLVTYNRTGNPDSDFRILKKLKLAESGVEVTINGFQSPTDLAKLRPDLINSIAEGQQAEHFLSNDKIDEYIGNDNVQSLSPRDNFIEFNRIFDKLSNGGSNISPGFGISNGEVGHMFSINNVIKNDDGSLTVTASDRNSINFRDTESNVYRFKINSDGIIKQIGGDDQPVPNATKFGFVDTRDATTVGGSIGYEQADLSDQQKIGEALQKLGHYTVTDSRNKANPADPTNKYSELRIKPVYSNIRTNPAAKSVLDAHSLSTGAKGYRYVGTYQVQFVYPDGSTTNVKLREIDRLSVDPKGDPTSDWSMAVMELDSKGNGGNFHEYSEGENNDGKIVRRGSFKIELPNNNNPSIGSSYQSGYAVAIEQPKKTENNAPVSKQFFDDTQSEPFFSGLNQTPAPGSNPAPAPKHLDPKPLRAHFF